MDGDNFLIFCHSARFIWNINKKRDAKTNNWIFSERKKIICFESLIKNKSELIYNFVILNYIKKNLARHDVSLGCGYKMFLGWVGGIRNFIGSSVGEGHENFSARKADF